MEKFPRKKPEKPEKKQEKPSDIPEEELEKRRKEGIKREAKQLLWKLRADTKDAFTKVGRIRELLKSVGLSLEDIDTSDIELESLKSRNK